MKATKSLKTHGWVLAAVLIILLPASAAGEDIIVSAAASLTNALTAVGKAFEARHPDVNVVFNFAASGALLQQMIHGAPVDVFASANQHFMDRAADQNLILSETRRNFARNQLVLAAPSASSLTLAALDDLLNPTIQRLAVGSPATVPAGRYTRQVLADAGVWEAMGGKLIYANSVRQVLDYIRREEVDLGAVYATDAHQAGQAVRVVKVLETEVPIVYPIAAVNNGQVKAGALAFIDFSLSPGAMAILARFGFSAP